MYEVNYLLQPLERLMKHVNVKWNTLDLSRFSSDWAEIWPVPKPASNLSTQKISVELDM